MTADPEEIRREIESTRLELSADVDALTEKVSPSRVVERRVQGARHAVGSVKERVMGTASDGTSNAGDAVGSAASSVAGGASSMASATADTVAAAPDAMRRQTRGNPLAAGVIAFGAGWLLASLMPATEPEQRIAEQAKGVAQEHAGPVKEQLTEAAQEMKDNLRGPAQEAVQSVRSTTSDATSTVTDEAKSAADDLSDRAQEAQHSVRDQGSA
jgi:uncharacterized protein YjbJ (UPF0337 family)